MMSIFWVGARESDIENEKMFCGSITRYGRDNANNLSFCNNNFTNSYDEFLEKCLQQRIENNDNCKFLFSNEMNAYKFGETLYRHAICLNKLSIVESLNNKMFFRQFFNQIVNVPPAITINICEDTDYCFINSIFNDTYDKYVVQTVNSGGGEGSIMVSKNSNFSLLSKLNSPVLITPYLKNTIPVNVHIAVSKEEIYIFPPSIQLIHNNFSYVGADFIKYAELDKSIKNKILSDCLLLAKKVQFLGAYGVFGVDILIDEDKLYFIECNFRYQGSSFVLNTALLDSKLPSIFQIHYAAFSNELHKIPKEVCEVDVNFSSFRRTISNQDVRLPSPLQLKMDGNNINSKLRNGYMYYELFDKSIYDYIAK